MTRRNLRTAALISLCALLLLATPTGQAVSQSIREVFVVNFPEIQRVEGTVAVEGVLHLAEMRAFRNLVVPPVRPTETTRLVDAGILVTDGFSNVVLSLHGGVRGTVQRTGQVGAFLIPDEESVLQALDEQGMMHFMMETTASGVSSQTPYFASAQPRYEVAFPRYRVLLYNTTDKTVSANLFAYLTD